MKKISLYTGFFFNATKKEVNKFVDIPAKYEFNYYKPYQYFAQGLFPYQVNTKLRNFDEKNAYESFARARRTILFTDTTNLRPTNFNRIFNPIYKKVSSVTLCDHLSYWVSKSGTKFLMIEPYEDLHSNGTIKKLESMGLSVIEVPIQLSPYCGRWDPNPGTLPWTKCYLICDSENSHELDMIEVELLLAKVPAWNRI